MLKYIAELIIGIIFTVLILASISCSQPQQPPQDTTQPQQPQDTVPYLWNNGSGVWCYKYNIYNNVKFDCVTKVTFHEEWIELNDIFEQLSYVGVWSDDRTVFTSDEGVVFQISRKKLTRIEKSGQKEIYVNP